MVYKFCIFFSRNNFFYINFGFVGSVRSVIDEIVIFYCYFIVKSIYFSLSIVFKVIVCEGDVNWILNKYYSSEMRFILMKFKIVKVNIFCFLVFIIFSFDFDFGGFFYIMNNNLWI